VPFDDLRAYLAALDKAGQLLRITDRVDPEPDLAAAGAAAARMGETAPALYFDNVAGFADPRIVMNAHGSWVNHAIALGLPPATSVREQVAEFARRWDQFPVPPQRRDSPPFEANTAVGDDVDLFGILPLFRMNEGDGGFYLDKAVTISRDPDAPEDTGKQNVGIYRMQVKGPRRLGLQPLPSHDIARHLRAAEQHGHDLPVAIALGNDPVITLAGSMSLAYEQSEYEVAGALRGAPAPIAVVPESELEVPWGCEVLLEGRVLAGVREIEGPFGEFTGHYSGGRRMPVIEIDRAFWRTDTIFETLYLGMPWTELDYLIGPATCVPLLKQIRQDFPEVTAVNAMYTHGLLAIISTGRRYGGFGKAVGMRALTTPHGLGYCKVVIVVDEDVDPFNLPQVMWAITTKFNPAYDLVNVPNLSVLALDPSSEPPGITGKLIIDATTPVAPERRGHYGQPVRDPADTAEWIARLGGMRVGR
jgi:UbiD family decarboxylase